MVLLLLYFWCSPSEMLLCNRVYYGASSPFFLSCYTLCYLLDIISLSLCHLKTQTLTHTHTHPRIMLSLYQIGDPIYASLAHTVILSYSGSVCLCVRVRVYTQQIDNVSAFAAVIHKIYKHSLLLLR